jgi:hypothetical protein
MRTRFTDTFKDWEIDNRRAIYNKYSLNISDGFLSFSDVTERYLDNPCTELFLYGFNFIERYLLWKELKREIRKRAMAKVELMQSK